VVAGHRLELAGGLGHHGREVDGPVRGDAPGVGAREQEQVGDQAAHPPRRAQRGRRGLARLALELHLEQLEVGKHGGERGAQLVRGVGDELALARERGLRLVARLVERAEHALQGQRQLGHLVARLGVRDGQRRVARARDRAGGVRQPRDRRHGARRGGQAGQQRQRGAAEHAEAEEHAHAVRGRLDVGQLARVLDVEHAVAERDRARLDQEPVPLLRLGARRQQVRGVRRRREHRAVLGDEPDDRVLARRVRVEVRAALGQRRPDVALEEALLVDLDPRPHGALQVGGGVLDVALEVVLDLPRRQHADDRGEAEQDHQRQRRGAAGEAPADRQPLIRGGRSPRRGPYEGAWARHRLPASSAGWTRTPRSCS
jgi:hypothetical protein